MLDWIKKQSIASWVLAGAAVLALIAMIIYIVNSTTGILAGTQMSALPIVFTIIAILLMAGIVATAGKLNHWIVTVAMIVAVVFLSVSFCTLIGARTDIAGDQWFIPDMDTAEQGKCLNVAIASVAFYVLSVIAVIAASVIGKFHREKA